MMSSMREPVSMSAVATIVGEPPFSMLRAAPKNRFGRCSALLSTPPESTLPDGGHAGHGAASGAWSVLGRSDAAHVRLRVKIGRSSGRPPKGQR